MRRENLPAPVRHATVCVHDARRELHQLSDVSDQQKIRRPIGHREVDCLADVVRDLDDWHPAEPQLLLDVALSVVPRHSQDPPRASANVSIILPPASCQLLLFAMRCGRLQLSHGFICCRPFFGSFRFLVCGHLFLPQRLRLRNSGILHREHLPDQSFRFLVCGHLFLPQRLRLRNSGILHREHLPDRGFDRRDDRGLRHRLYDAGRPED